MATTAQWVKENHPEILEMVKALKPGDHVVVSRSPLLERDYWDEEEERPEEEIHRIATVGVGRHGIGKGVWLETELFRLPCGTYYGRETINMRTGVNKFGRSYVSRVASEDEYSAFLAEENARRVRVNAKKEAGRAAEEAAKRSDEKSGALAVENAVVMSLLRAAPFASESTSSRRSKLSWALLEQREDSLRDSGGMLPGEEAWLLALPVPQERMRKLSAIFYDDRNWLDRAFLSALEDGETKGYWLGKTFRKAVEKAFAKVA